MRKSESGKKTFLGLMPILPMMIDGILPSELSVATSTTCWGFSSNIDRNGFPLAFSRAHNIGKVGCLMIMFPEFPLENMGKTFIH